jgi:uncharacterized protein YqgV (UPF0045/DUF77 family)
MSNQPHVEFLVEPFEEGRPGPHVAAAVAAFEQQGLPVDLGPFSSSSSGTIDAIAEAVAEMIRSSMNTGASAIRIQVGAAHSDLDGVGSLKNALTDIVRAAERELGADVGDWDRIQKQTAVRMFHERGAFLLRGAVDDIAKIMGVSRITIYNYINTLS